MINVGVHRFVVRLAVSIFLVFPIAAYAALPFKVKPGHPRLYLDSARVAAIQSAANVPIPLNGVAFPQTQGTLELDIYPQPILDPTVCANVDRNSPPSKCLAPVFDVHDSSRNHVFLRHLDYNEFQPNQQIHRFQVALQAKNGDYVASNNFSLSPVTKLLCISQPPKSMKNICLFAPRKFRTLITFATADKSFDNPLSGKVVEKVGTLFNASLKTSKVCVVLFVLEEYVF